MILLHEILGNSMQIQEADLRVAGLAREFTSDTVLEHTAGEIISQSSLMDTSVWLWSSDRT